MAVTRTAKKDCSIEFAPPVVLVVISVGPVVVGAGEGSNLK